MKLKPSAVALVLLVAAPALAYQWNAESAPQKLADHLVGTWFGEALLRKIEFRPHSTTEAIGVLADAAGASPEHRGQLESILSLLKGRRPRDGRG